MRSTCTPLVSHSSTMGLSQNEIRYFMPNMVFFFHKRPLCFHKDVVVIA